MFKVKTGQDFQNLSGFEGPVFDEDFYDCILYPKRSLDVLYRYLRDNPRRLAVRREHPEFFRRVNCMEIGDGRFQAYGNIQLLENPFKEQVVVHRRDGEAERDAKRQLWFHTGANGGVLVSPFISPAEKDIRREAEAVGSRIILVTNATMGERYKPSESDFALCESGRLLIISYPGELTRQKCLDMNRLAEMIAGA